MKKESFMELYQEAKQKPTRLNRLLQRLPL